MPRAAPRPAELGEDVAAAGLMSVGGTPARMIKALLSYRIHRMAKALSRGAAFLACLTEEEERVVDGALVKLEAETRLQAARAAEPRRGRPKRPGP